MIIDEVKTGFRVARGGVQELMGVKADLCTLPRQWATATRSAWSQGARTSCASSATASCTAHLHLPFGRARRRREDLEILDETPALRSIAEYGTKMRSGISQILAQRGIRHSFTGNPSMSGLFFSETPPHDYRDWARSDYTFYEALAPELHDLGVLCEPDSREPWFVCEAHDQRCLDETLQRFEEAVDRVVRRQPSPEPARCAS